ncbi:MAG: branched-chain amino acid aminotransferase [Bacteroidetes bacterium]|nr:branched-chain amino acid aminotransferase [Bacteroidota bacterium]
MKDLKWSELPFGYLKTDYNIRCYYRDGQWGKLETSSSEYVPLHMAATCLHYGQEAFEGMKAFQGKDGKVRVFRWEENHKRMNRSAHGIMMAELPPELFKQAIFKAIKMNMDYVPPYGTGAALYIRPLLLGSGPQIGVKPAAEYLFIVFVTPVGPYFKEGFSPVEFLLTEEFDRAAPQGTGNIKVGGNYAASLRAMKKAHDTGFANVLFLDSKEKKYIDEAGPANFFGIKNNTYVTPKSPTILPSITNMSLCTIAEEMGLKVERRPIPKAELAEFEEAGACGTAAVISPIKRIYDDSTGENFNYGQDGKPGQWSTKLYKHLQGIQYGDIEDKYAWIAFVE